MAKFDIMTPKTIGVSLIKYTTCIQSRTDEQTGGWTDNVFTIGLLHFQCDALIIEFPLKPLRSLGGVCAYNVYGQTGRQTDRQTDRVIPIYPQPTLFAEGINRRTTDMKCRAIKHTVFSSSDKHGPLAFKRSQVNQYLVLLV